VSPDGLEPSTHSLKDNYTTTLFPLFKKKPSFNLRMSRLKANKYVKSKL
jgi:hypothetical protein